jgi:hypothetical protein
MIFTAIGKQVLRLMAALGLLLLLAFPALAQRGGPTSG